MATSQEIRGFVDRILRLKQEEDDVKKAIRDVYAEAALREIDKTGLGQVVTHVRKRGKNPTDFDAKEAVFHGYLALYDASLTHAHAYARVRDSELTDTQESDQPDEAVVPATAAVASDDVAAQDDAGATASSTNSPDGANEKRDSGPSQPAILAARQRGEEDAVDPVVPISAHREVSDSAAPSSRQPDTAGSAPPPAVPAPLSDDLEIPEFLRRTDKGCMARRESEVA